MSSTRSYGPAQLTETEPLQPEPSAQPIVDRVACAESAARSLDLTLPAAIGLAGLAAVVRLWNLTAQDPFVDEAAWIHWAVDLFIANDPTTYWIPVHIFFRPPLFYWLIVLTTSVTDNAIIGGRLGAALPDVLSTVGIYFLGRSLFSARVGMVAGLLWALNPYAVFFARIASDDALLACFMVLATLGAVHITQRPSRQGAASTGVLLGLAVMTKTLGLLGFGWLLLALVMFSRRDRHLQSVIAGLQAGAVAGLVLLPLVPWWRDLARGVTMYARLSSQGSTATADVGGPLAGALVAIHTALALDQFAANWNSFTDWVPPLLGPPVLILAPTSLLLAGRRLTRGHVYLALLWVCTTFVVLDRTQALFSRYLLFTSFPLFVLAADGLVRLASVAAQAGARLAGSYRIARRERELGLAMLGCGLTVTLATTAPLVVTIVTRPAAAAISIFDHYQYFEQWWALYGLGQVVDYLKDQARQSQGPVTILVPSGRDQFRPQLPESPLRAWLRHDPSVQFLDEPALVTAESLCDLRNAAWQGPTFVVLNGAYALSVGAWPEVPRATRHLEAALARDLPTASAVLRIPRQATPAWLTVYRVDSSDAERTDGRETCYVPTPVFDQRWQDGGTAAITDDPLRMTTDRAGYAEGPLPQGWYRPIVWAHELPPDISVHVLADGQDLGPVEAVEQGGDGWRWVAPPKSVLVSSGGHIQLEFQVRSASPTVPTDKGRPSALVVRDVVLQRARLGAVPYGGHAVSTRESTV